MVWKMAKASPKKKRVMSSGPVKGRLSASNKAERVTAGRLFVSDSAFFGCQRFGQPERNHEQVDGHQSGGYKGRDSVAPLAEQSTAGWADDEAQPEGSTDHPQTFGAILGIGHIGDVSLRHTDVAAGQTVQDAGSEQDQQCVGKTEQQEAKQGAYQTEKQDRAASEAVRQAAQDWRADQLRGGIGCHQQADDRVAGAEGFGVVGQQGQDQPEAEHVDEYD